MSLGENENLNFHFRLVRPRSSVRIERFPPKEEARGSNPLEDAII